MADLSQGNFASVVLNPGDTLRVITSGSATVESKYGAPAGTTTVTANSQLFGPYGVLAKLRITAVTGSCTYVQPTQVPVTVDQSSGVVNPPGAVSGAGFSGSGLCVLAGDSRTEFGWFRLNIGAGAFLTKAEGWWTQLNQLMGGSLRAYACTALAGQAMSHLMNYQLPAILGMGNHPQGGGVVAITGNTTSGDTNQQIVLASTITGIYPGMRVYGAGIQDGTLVVSAASATVVLSRRPIATQTGGTINFVSTQKPGLVFLMLDVNDFYLNSVTAAVHIAAMTRVLTDLGAAGLTVVLSNGTPYGPTGVSYSTAKQTEQLAYVAWCNTVAPTLFPKHIFVDTYSIAANADGTLASGWTYDDIHPQFKYARAMAVAYKAKLPTQILRALTTRIASTSDKISLSAYTRQILENADGTGSAIGSTNRPSWLTVATQTNVSAIAYRTIANPYGVGNAIEMTVTFSAAGQFAIKNTETFSAGSRIAAADVIVASAVVSTSDPSGIVKNTYVQANISDGTSTKSAYGDWAGSSSPQQTVNFAGEVIVSPPMDAFAALTSATHEVDVLTTGAGTVTLTIAECGIWKQVAV